MRCNKDMGSKKSHSRDKKEALMTQIKAAEMKMDLLLHDNIDQDRLIWDQNYRNKVKEFLNDDMTKYIHKNKGPKH